jgi:hypothetical protein
MFIILFNNFDQFLIDIFPQGKKMDTVYIVNNIITPRASLWYRLVGEYMRQPRLMRMRRTFISKNCL